MSKEYKEFNYNNINKFIGDYKKKGKSKKLLSKTINLNNINNNFNKKINKYKNHKSSSCISISESEMPEKNNEQYSDISDDKLTIKTTLLRNNETRNNNNSNINDEPNKYHINFELLSNAGINNNININMTFI